MRGLYIAMVLILLGSLKVAGQQYENENIDLLKSKVFNQSSEKIEKGGLYGIYQNVFSDQILNDCIYDRSCSAFSKDVFRHFNPLKGLMLTVDRLTRCNRATYSQISLVLIDDNGKAYDHWDYYVKK